MGGSHKGSVGAAAVVAAIAAAYLTIHHGLLIGICGGAVIGGLVGLVMVMMTRNRD